jgi:uncharacterized membrane protein YGL010W
MFLFAVLIKFFEAKIRVLSSVLGLNSTRLMAVCVRVLYCRVCVCACVRERDNPLFYQMSKGTNKNKRAGQRHSAGGSGL